MGARAPGVSGTCPLKPPGWPDQVVHLENRAQILVSRPTARGAEMEPGGNACSGTPPPCPPYCLPHPTHCLHSHLPPLCPTVHTHSGPTRTVATHNAVSNRFSPACSRGSLYRNQARILEWIAVLPSRGSSRRRDRNRSLTSPVWAGGFFTSVTTWEVPRNHWGT